MLGSSESGLGCELKGQWRERVNLDGTWVGRAVWVGQVGALAMMEGMGVLG